MATLSQHSHQIQHHQHHSITSGLGLLTTVAQLPPKYRSRYLNLKTKFEIPLDLSVKPFSPNDQITTSSSSTISNNNDKNCQQENEQPPITPPPSPQRKRKFSQASDESSMSSSLSVQSTQSAGGNLAVDSIYPQTSQSSTSYNNPGKMMKTEVHLTIKRDVTPSKPIKCESAPKTAKAHPPAAKPSRNKATRKLKFDEDTSSPVSGTVIRPLEEINEGNLHYSNGDIDPKYNIVEITEETKAELAAIKNVIGDYVCRLCRIKFDDAFGLAQHRCSCIVLLEYRCPECGKQFNCPANLASHRRWHKPKKTISDTKKENQIQPESQETASQFNCDECGKSFKRAAYLRKHKLTHKKQASISKPIRVKEESLSESVISGRDAQSVHSNEDEGIYTNDYDDMNSMDSDSSSSSGRLQIVEHNLTEEENIAATALTNLRNCTSVIQHTTVVVGMAH
ncbi:insulinoma-associated protein 1 [Eupeodes corollae]|uniref:insulinoma-associated protein 1 n=1 Tax=Eupeodes corollae TaxID=290404 RepID=UPI0024933C45|nr:insulinoma-associated protein 1 [Eupeodes corollae]